MPGSILSPSGGSVIANYAGLGVGLMVVALVPFRNAVLTRPPEYTLMPEELTILDDFLPSH